MKTTTQSQAVDFDRYLDRLIESETKAKRVYSYIRFSAERQAEGDSLRRQVALRDAWIARKGLVLDDSLSLQDLGVSAFRLANIQHGALAGFIQAVRQGKVPKGSYLVIEKLDRFSRADTDESLPIFAELVKAGIVIVTLEPEKEWDREAIRGFGIMELVLHFVLANQESQKKSERLGHAWAEKRRKATEKLLTKRMPGWLVVEDGKIVRRQDKVKIIQRIFDLAENGHGTSQIAIILNEEKTPALSWGEGWHGASISKILRGRSVLGEYRPCTNRTGKRRVPVGEPIPDYYPAIITEAQWLRVQSSLDGRKLARGKVGRAVNNLFMGLLRDARDGGIVRLKRVGRSQYLQPRNAMRGFGGEKFAFSYRAFERYILSFLREVEPAELTRPEDHTEIKTTIARLAEVDRKLEKIKARLLGDGDFDSLLDVAAKLEAERKLLIQEISQSQKSTPAIQRRDLKEATTILGLLDGADGEDELDLRAKLKGLIRGLVKEIWVLVSPLGDGGKLCFAQLEFKAGGSRMVWIVDAGKHVKHFKGQPLDIGSSHRMNKGLFDLKNYEAQKLVRDAFANTAKGMEEITPKAEILRRIAEGEKPYKVAREFGIANSTAYRWMRENAP